VTAGSAAAATSTRLVIARHAETEGNVARVHQGRTDSPLTAAGREQIAALADKIRKVFPETVAVYGSPTGRARQTAAEVAGRFGLVAEIDTNLVEGSFGDWEGRSAAEFAALGFWETAKADPDYAAPGGESLRQCGERAAATFWSIAQRHCGHTVVVVTHQGPVCQGLAVMLQTPFPGFEYGLANGGFRELLIEAGRVETGLEWRAAAVRL
jgi:probable phosphoglycerate mutase